MTPAKIWAVVLFSMLAALTTGPATAQTFPDRGRAAVVDGANEIPDKQEQALAAMLTAWERETGHQLVVATVPDLQGYTISDFANGLVRHWRLGRAGVNDGILILHAPHERKIRIEVGYGLEGSVTDLLSSRIIHDTIIPDLDADPGQALTLGAMRVMEAASGPEEGGRATGGGTAPARFAALPPADDGPSVWTVLLLSFLPAILIVVLLVWLFRRSRKPLPTGPARPLSKRAQRRREQRERARARGVTFDFQQAGGAGSSSDTSSSWWSSSDGSSSSSSSDSGSSWSSSDSGGGFDSGGGSSGGGGSDSSY